MTAAPPRTAREVRLAAVPEGLPSSEHFAVVETPLPEPGPDQVLVRNRYFLVFPGLRTLVGKEADGLPLPPLREGDTLFGPAVGEVVTAPAGSPLRTGDTVVHLLGWREYALVPAAGCARADDTLPDPVAHLSRSAGCCPRRPVPPPVSVLTDRTSWHGSVSSASCWLSGSPSRTCAAAPTSASTHPGPAAAMRVRRLGRVLVRDRPAQTRGPRRGDRQAGRTARAPGAAYVRGGPTVRGGLTESAAVTTRHGAITAAGPSSALRAPAGS